MIEFTADGQGEFILDSPDEPRVRNLREVESVLRSQFVGDRIECVSRVDAEASFSGQLDVLKYDGSNFEPNTQ